MTRIATGLRELETRAVEKGPEAVWWSVGAVSIVALTPFIRASDLIPDGTIVREVQIQGFAGTDQFITDFSVYLSIVSSKNPSDAEIMAGERIIDWRQQQDFQIWRSYGHAINESWPCHKTLRGSNMHFGVAIVSADANGVRARVSVLYSP